MVKTQDKQVTCIAGDDLDMFNPTCSHLVIGIMIAI